MKTDSSYGVTVQPHQAIRFTQIQMMDATSGWAWALDETEKRLLLRTSDGGQTWTMATPPGDISQAYPPYAAYLLDAQTAWAILADDQLVRTSDGGQTWEVINQNLASVLVWPAHDWYILRFADVKHGWLETGFSAAGAHEYYYETQDGGVTWKPMDFETWPAELAGHQDAKNEIAYWGNGIDAIYYDATRFIIALGAQERTLSMFLSTNRGHSWKNVDLPSTAPPAKSFNPFDRQISTPIFFDAQNGALTVSILDRDTSTTQLSVYRTRDGGLSWTLTGGPSIIQDVHSAISFLSPRDAVLVCGSHLCATHDGGNTWLTLGFGIPISIDNMNTFAQLDFINPVTGWVLFRMSNQQSARPSSRLLKTTDGGLTWMELHPVIMP